MKALLKTSLLGLAFISTASMAQTSAFSGAAVGASVNLSGASFKITNTDNDYSTYGEQNLGLALSASYGLDVSSEILVLLGVDLDFIEKNFGELMIVKTTPTQKILCPCLLPPACSSMKTHWYMERFL